MLKSIWIGFVFFIAGTAFATVEIVWFQGGAVVEDGSTRSNPILVPAGALTQLIWAGPDNLRSPPDFSNPPHFTGGDDVVLARTNLVSAGGFGQMVFQQQFSIPGSAPEAPSSAYGRVFSSANPGSTDCRYANTPLVELAEQTERDMQPADAVDLTRSPTFTTIAELNNVPVLVTRLHCTDMAGCMAVDIDRGVDADGEYATAVPVGSGPFQFEWSASAGSQTNATAVGLAVGEHTVVVTDLSQVDCVVTSMFTVYPTLSFLLETRSASCEVGTGEAQILEVFGGSGELSYRWTGPFGAFTSEDFALDLPVGQYWVEVYDDNGNSSLQSFEITADFNDIEFELVIEPATCGDIAAGALSVTNLSGGSGSYTITWEGEAGTLEGTRIDGLLPGPYRVSVTDPAGNGCQVVRDVVLHGAGTGPVINCASETVINLCPDETIDVVAIGLGLATDEDGNPLVPHGEPEAYTEGCFVFATYHFSLTNDCDITRCTANVTIKPPAPVVEARPASFEDRQLPCDSGLPIPDLLALDSLFSSCLAFEVTIRELSPRHGCLGPDSDAGYIFIASDSCGQLTTFTQLFTWASDTTPPVAQPVPLLTIEECGILPDPDPARIQASDDCSADLERRVIRETRVPLNDGMSELIRTWVVADRCGNTTTVDEVIHFMDAAIAPRFINLPQTHFYISTNLTVPDYINNPPAGFLPIIPSNDVTLVTITQDPPAGTTLERSAAITVLFTIENQCGRLETNGLTSFIRSNNSFGGGSILDIAGVVQNVDGFIVFEDDAVPVSVPILRTTPDLQGAVWLDYDGNGRLGNSLVERMMDGIVVYLDVNNDGVRNSFEPSVQTDSNGEYAFYNLELGVHNLTLDLPLGYTMSTGTVMRQVQVTDGETMRETFALRGAMQADTLAWLDIDMDGSPIGENLNGLAVAGVPVVLYAEIESILETLATQITDESGIASFQNLLPGIQYFVEIQLDENVADQLSTPESYPFEIQPKTDGSTPERFVVSQGGAPLDRSGLFLAFGLTTDPTAVRLDRIEAVGDIIRWTTGWEQDTLGFFVMRQVGDGEPEQVNRALILANGGGSGASYELVDPAPPPAGGDVQYFIREIETDLDVEDYDPVSLVHAATPVGEPVTLIANAAAGDIITTDGAGSLLVSGIDSEAPLLDVTDPARPIPLRGERLETDSASGVYFSWPAGRRIQLP